VNREEAKRIYFYREVRFCMDALGVVIFSTLAALGLLLVLWLVFGALLLPIRRSASEDVVILLNITGSDPGLAETVRSLLWLRQGLRRPPHIVIVDAGMDKATLEKARFFAASYSGIMIVTSKEVGNSEVWMNRTDS
jgi:hypothetical protein